MCQRTEPECCMPCGGGCGMESMHVRRSTQTAAARCTMHMHAHACVMCTCQSVQHACCALTPGAEAHPACTACSVHGCILVSNAVVCTGPRHQQPVIHCPYSAAALPEPDGCCLGNDTGVDVSPHRARCGAATQSACNSPPVPAQAARARARGALAARPGQPW